MSKILQDFGNQYCKSSVPDLKPGYLVAVHQKIKEGSKERVQVFQGTVIKTNAGHGVNDNFTVRKVSEGVGVERTFPIHSSTIVKVVVLRAHKVRRAKLNYLRDLSGKALRMQEVSLDLKEKTFNVPVAKASEEASAVSDTKEADDNKEVVADAEPEVVQKGEDDVTDAPKVPEKAETKAESVETPAKEAAIVADQDATPKKESAESTEK